MVVLTRGFARLRQTFADNNRPSAGLEKHLVYDCGGGYQVVLGRRQSAEKLHMRIEVVQLRDLGLLSCWTDPEGDGPIASIGLHCSGEVLNCLKHAIAVRTSAQALTTPTESCDQHA
eukprot:1380996-Rhodomonas_salina.1